MNCNECGLPVSLVDDPTVSDEPYWYCDGPNDGTDEDGCGATQAVEPGVGPNNPKPEKIGTHCECGAPYAYLERHDRWGYTCAR